VKKLVCVVEGHGEVRALPTLCHRILARLERWDWHVLPEAMRSSRSKLVDQRIGSPRRPPQPAEIARVVALALAARADAVLILVDSDDDCPVSWGPPASTLIRTRVAGAAVMAVREYEAWLLHHYSHPAAEATRDAKKAVREFVPGYNPATHQLEVTKLLDIAKVRASSPSFDKLVRTIGEICAA